jgi:hypothetical protein
MFRETIFAADKREISDRVFRRGCLASDFAQSRNASLKSIVRNSKCSYWPRRKMADDRRAWQRMPMAPVGETDSAPRGM